MLLSLCGCFLAVATDAGIIKLYDVSKRAKLDASSLPVRRTGSREFQCVRVFLVFVSVVLFSFCLFRFVFCLFSFGFVFCCLLFVVCLFAVLCLFFCSSLFVFVF